MKRVSVLVSTRLGPFGMGLALMTVAACAQVSTPPPPAAAPSSPSSTSAPLAATSGGFPMTISDDMGRQVRLPVLPQRIISLAPSDTEILFAVGAGDQVVGVTTYCNYPPEAQDREKIGGFTANTISVEKIVALEPDLVVAAGAIQQSVIDALEKTDIPVVALDPNTLEDVYTTIELVGRLTGHADQAARVVADMQARVDSVTQRLAAVPEAERLSVYWEVFDEPRMTAGPSTYIGQLIDLAGGVNIFGDVSEQYPQINDEEVIQRNPAVIMGADTMGEKLTTAVVAQRPGWDQIDAVRNGRIYLFDGDMVSRSSPRLAQVLEMMAQALYPDLFK
jgi:iron complex transport system substrate-binding protein